MRASVRGIPCRLTSATARVALGVVLDQIRIRAPDDWARIRRVVTLVCPLTPEQCEDGTLGWWLASTAEPEIGRPETYGYEPGNRPGVVLVNEDQRPWQLRAVLAHELGHACTTYDDLRYGNIPDSGWQSEAAADRYAYRWGFGRIIARHRPYRSRSHHGPTPGETFWFPAVGRWRVQYRVTRRFRFVQVEESPPAGRKK